jgi:hypothetical protein
LFSFLCVLGIFAVQAFDLCGQPISMMIDYFFLAYSHVFYDRDAVLSKTDFTAEPQSSQSEGYFIRIPERGILIKSTLFVNATAIIGCPVPMVS